MSRETFLARVRQAAVAGRAYRVHPPTGFTSESGYCGAGPDPVARMAREVELVGGKADLVEDLPAAANVLSKLLDDYRIHSPLCWQHPLLERLGLGELLHARGIEPLDYDTLAALDESARRAKLFGCDLGITSATWAIAETGTLVMAAGPGRERLASLLPPRHVAIIEASQIVPDLFDFFATAANEGLEHLASNVTFITGPSKTGDLELRLVTGVHGPGEWHVIIVRAG